MTRLVLVLAGETGAKAFTAAVTSLIGHEDIAKLRRHQSDT